MGKSVEDFLLSLDKPLQLNEMRVMKDANYLRFREILSDGQLYGDRILSLFKTHHKQLSLSHKAYDAVYEGLFDLYCKRPQVPDLTPKKLEQAGFVQKVKLIPT